MSGSSPKSISISGVETDITIGKELAAVAQKSKALASRDCFEQLEMYLHGRSHDRVCLLFGLLQTGKNTMLRQAIGRMTKEDLSRIAYIKARRTDNSRCFIFRRITMNRVLRIDEEKPEMHISVQGYKVTLCFAEKENPEVAVLVKQALLSAYAMPQK